jgi:hypothetical protein
VENQTGYPTSPTQYILIAGRSERGWMSKTYIDCLSKQRNFCRRTALSTHLSRRRINRIRWQIRGKVSVRWELPAESKEKKDA